MRCRRWPSCWWRASPTRAHLDVIDLGGRLRRAGADARTPDGRRRLLELEGDPRVASALHAGQAVFLQDKGPADEGPVLGRSVTLVPLVARGRAVGVLSLGWREAGRRPARDEWSLVEALAQRIALAVEVRCSTASARTSPRPCRPASCPRHSRRSRASRWPREYVAAGGGMDVGGDFYDVFALDDGAWILVIGDVLGKGAEAAAVTALARYTCAPWRAAQPRRRRPSRRSTTRCCASATPIAAS